MRRSRAVTESEETRLFDPGKDLEKLAEFVVKAKLRTYAGDGKEVKPERAGFKELEYKEGVWAYRDSYTGFYAAPGQEVVRFDGRPIWVMSYNGGMMPEYIGDIEFAKTAFMFLKLALSKVTVSRPFRGPEMLMYEGWEYRDRGKGDITNFNRGEHILFKGRKVFAQDYIGGLVIHKDQQQE